MINRIANLVRSPLLVIGLLLLGVAVYIPALKGPFILDDQAIQLAAELKNSLYDALQYSPIELVRERTLARASFLLNHLVVESSSAFWFRFTNLLFHLLNGLLVFFLARRIGSFLSADNTDSRAFGVISLAIFVLHPIQSQAVNYVTQRMILLATLFLLTSILIYFQIRTTSDRDRKSWLLRGGFLTAVAFALLSKPTAIVLFPMLVLIELLLIKNTIGKNQWLVFLSFCIIGIVGIGLSIDGKIDTPRVTGIQYSLTQITVILKYFKILLWPNHLSVDHLVEWWPHSNMAQTAVASLIHIFLLGLAWIKRSAWPIVTFSIGWIYLSLLPESFLIPLKDAMMEHRMYLPLVGVSLLMAKAIVEIKNRNVYLSVFAVVVLYLSAFSLLRNMDWKDEDSLWKATLDVYPNSARALYSLGRYNLVKGDTSSAAEYFSQALESNHEHVPSASAAALLMIERGEYDSARSLLENALYLEPFDATAHQNMGYLFEKLNKPHKAIFFYKKAAKLSKHSVSANVDLGTLYLQMGEPEKAIEQFQIAIDYGTPTARLYNNLGYAFETLGRSDEAIYCFEKALALDQHYLLAKRNLYKYRR